MDKILDKKLQDMKFKRTLLEKKENKMETTIENEIAEVANKLGRLSKSAIDDTFKLVRELNSFEAGGEII